MSKNEWQVKGHYNPNGIVFVVNPRKEVSKQQILDIPELPKVEPIKKNRRKKVNKDV